MLKFSVPVTLAVLALGALAPASQARPASADVEIANRPATLRADGAVDVALWVRCEPSLQAFELDTGVSQEPSTFGATNLNQAGVVPCDGSRQRRVITVYPESGAFTTGRATLSVYAGFYDSVSGRDLEATDETTVRLVRR